MGFRVSEDMGCMEEEKREEGSWLLDEFFLPLGKYGWPVLFGLAARAAAAAAAETW